MFITNFEITCWILIDAREEANMYGYKKLILLFIFFALAPGALKSQELKKESVDDRLARIETNLLNLEKRLDERFEFIDQRFEAVDKRFDDLIFYLQVIFGATILILAAVIAQWLLVWRKVDRIEARVEERIVIGYRIEEMQELKKRIERLEAAVSK
jgi:hypothetical protein